MIECEYIYNKDFTLETGALLQGLKVAYHVSERFRRDHDAKKAASQPSDDAGQSFGEAGQTIAGTSKPKVIWICHALTANSDAEDWWKGLVGPGRFIDTEKYWVICANILGSPYGTSGPASLAPDGRPWKFRFPEFTVRDIAKVLDLLRNHLNISKIDLLVGSSVGGFQALEWSIIAPEAIGKAVYMATAARVSPWLTAWNESQRMALEADTTFRGPAAGSGAESGAECGTTARAQSAGLTEPHASTQTQPNGISGLKTHTHIVLTEPHAANSSLSVGLSGTQTDTQSRPAWNHPDLLGGREGLKAARAIALISYRSHAGYCLTQNETDPDTLFAGRAASYERYQGLKLANRFDAYSYWYLLRMLDSHNPGRGRGGVEKALESIRAKVTVISIDSDGLFPPVEGQWLADRIKGADFQVISSRFGHDGFLLESDQISGILGPLLEDM